MSYFSSPCVVPQAAATVAGGFGLPVPTTATSTTNTTAARASPLDAQAAATPLTSSTTSPPAPAVSSSSGSSNSPSSGDSPRGATTISSDSTNHTYSAGVVVSRSSNTPPPSSPIGVSRAHCDHDSLPQRQAHHNNNNNGTHHYNSGGAKSGSASSAVDHHPRDPHHQQRDHQNALRDHYSRTLAATTANTAGAGGAPGVGAGGIAGAGALAPFFCSEVYFSAWYNAHMNNNNSKLLSANPTPSSQQQQHHHQQQQIADHHHHHQHQLATAAHHHPHLPPHLQPAAAAALSPHLNPYSHLPSAAAAAAAAAAAHHKALAAAAHSSKTLPSALDDLPTMLSKGQVMDGRKSTGGGAPMTTSGGGGVVGGTLSAVAASKKASAKLHQQLHASLQAAHLESLASSPAKSMPIHCIVEQTVVSGGSPGNEKTTTEVDMDTYAILPSSTLFNEIIRVAMTKLGYSAVEAMGAKGAIQIRNWKPLTFDTITDLPDATVEEILGDLTSIATLRIRLCSRSKLNALEDVKEKLLQFLFQHSQSMLQSVGCPIEKGTLSRICKGDYPLNLPDDTRQAFERWYKDQTMMSQTMKREPQSDHHKEMRYEPAGGGLTSAGSGGGSTHPHHAHHPHHHRGLPSSYPTLRGELNLSMNSPSNGGTNSNGTANGSSNNYVPKPRIRTSFDPEHEIPRLHHWFQQNQHPSREQMVVFLNELNSLEHRRGRKLLDLTNIIYWFKNARAAQRRANRSSDVLSGEEPGSMDVEQDSMDDRDDADQEAAEREGERLSPISSESVPVLPNKNAVYVVSSPLHHGPQMTTVSSRSSSPVIHIIPQDPSDLRDKSEDASSRKPLSTGSGENGDEGVRPASRSSPSVLGSSLKGSTGELVVVENGQHSTHSDSELDEPMDYAGSEVEASSRPNGLDFSCRPRSLSVDSRSSSRNGGGSEKRDGLDSSGSGQSLSGGRGDLDSHPLDHHRLDIKQEMEHNRESDYPSSGSASGTTPSPQQHMLGLSGTPQPPPAHQSHAMAMAALPHPIPFHYMHSAAAAHALYGGLDSPLLGSQAHFKDSSAMSSEERKKRSRVFIDPLSEIPKLEKWFAEDTHPSSYMIEKYTEEMNRSEYRQRFPRLEPKNVQLWFKNHRAKVKRSRIEQQQGTPTSMPHCIEQQQGTATSIPNV